VEAGYHVQAMARDGSDQSCLAGVNVEWVRGDLADVASLSAPFSKAEIVVHAAAHIGDWGKTEQYRAINVFALEHLLSMVQQSDKFQRWIQISSLGVYPARHHYGTDETTPADLTGLDGYTRTKAEAEVLVRQHQQLHHLPAVILRPGFIYGPGERHSIPRVIEKFRNGKMKFIGKGDKVLNNIYVGNLADAILLAIKEPKALGETFNIRDQRLVTRQEYFHTIADFLGLPHPPHVPEVLARTLVGPIETMARWRGAEKPPLLTKALMKFMTLNLDFSIAKAQRVLGYQPQVDFREGMLETLREIVS
jgi:nucleoside-diphosphate-sugar epimerase